MSSSEGYRDIVAKLIPRMRFATFSEVLSELLFCKSSCAPAKDKAKQPELRHNHMMMKKITSLAVDSIFRTPQHIINARALM